MLFIFERAAPADLLDEEHVHPARHDLHRRRSRTSSASSRTRSRARSAPRRVAGVSQYVLEINGGLSAQAGHPRGASGRLQWRPGPLKAVAERRRDLPSRCWRRWRTRRSSIRSLVYEPKYDGIRAIVEVAPAAASGARAGPDRVARWATTRPRSFPRWWRRSTRWAREPGAGGGALILDGEIVALDDGGRAARLPAHPGSHPPDRRRRRRRRGGRASGRVRRLRSAARRRRDLRALPLAERRMQLEQLSPTRGRRACALRADRVGDGTAL